MNIFQHFNLREKVFVNRTQAFGLKKIKPSPKKVFRFWFLVDLRLPMFLHIVEIIFLGNIVRFLKYFETYY